MAAIAGPAHGLLDAVAHIQGTDPWGDVLDAGTGVQSIRWLAGLPTRRWTAVSADTGHLDESRKAVASAIRPQDRTLLGNWADPSFLAGEAFETVLAEYLLGAVEGYAPYFQENLFRRLRPLVRRRLYVVGVDPYANTSIGGGVGGLIQELGRLRDACALLAGQTPYREYPAEWVLERLEETGFRIVVAKRFPNRYGFDWIERQLADIRTLLAMIADRTAAAALSHRARSLRAEAEKACRHTGWIEHGSNYLIAADAA